MTFPHANSRYFDLAIRCILALFFAYCAGIYGQNAYDQLCATVHGLNARFLCRALAIAAVGLYTLMIACVYILRVQAVSKFAGWRSCIAALLGGFMGMGITLFRPDMNLPLSLQMVSSVIILIGNGLAAYVLSKLGRSFSILAEGRRLVTGGPYKIVRHPLYAVEAVATLGTLIYFWSLGALVLVAAQFAFQLIRINYEEKVLRETFPEYAAYAARTARLIPGVY